jgi:hypothetical protein
MDELKGLLFNALVTIGSVVIILFIAGERIEVLIMCSFIFLYLGQLEIKRELKK